jgi:hypothetical protein
VERALYELVLESNSNYYLNFQINNKLSLRSFIGEKLYKQLVFKIVE